MMPKTILFAQGCRDSQDITNNWYELFAYALTAGLLWTSGICAVLTSPGIAGGLIFSINIVACLSYGLMIFNTLYTKVDSVKYRNQTLIRLIDWLITFPLIQIEILFLWVSMWAMKALINYFSAYSVST